MKGGVAFFLGGGLYFTQNLKSVRIVHFWLWDIQVIQWADDNYDDDDDNDDNNHYQDHKHQLEDPPPRNEKIYI